MYLHSKEARIHRWRSIVRLGAQGLSQSAISEALDVDQSVVSRTLSRYAQEGELSFDRPSALGARRRLSKTDLNQLKRLLDQGARCVGYLDDSWTLKRIKALIQEYFQVSYSLRHVSRILDSIDYTRQKPQLKDHRQNAAKVAQWKSEELPAIKKAQEEGRQIAFEDETAISLCPVVQTTYAPRGQTLN